MTHFVRQIPGLPPDILLAHSDLIEKLIKEGDFKQLPKEIKMPDNKAYAQHPAIFWRPIIYGGNWAHIHWGDLIFIPKDEIAWSKFTTPVMSAFADRMKKAKYVSMDQMVAQHQVSHSSH